MRARSLASFGLTLAEREEISRRMPKLDGSCTGVTKGALVGANAIVEIVVKDVIRAQRGVRVDRASSATICCVGQPLRPPCKPVSGLAEALIP